MDNEVEDVGNFFILGALKRMVARSGREGSSGKINGEKDKCRRYWEKNVRRERGDYWREFDVKLCPVKAWM